MTYSQIAKRARHSAEAIKRYVQTFGRVLVARESGLLAVGEIAFVVGVSERLAGEYLALRERYSNAQYADRLEEIAHQTRRTLARNGEKKGAADERL
jgi:hypothetical protein